MKKGFYLDAEFNYTLAINSAEEPNPLLYINRAQSRFKLEFYPVTVIDCNNAIKIDPKYIKAYMIKARTQCAMGEISNAIKTLT